MLIGKVVTGPEERELNGPFKPPIWDGSDGTREGQHAFDKDAVLFTPAGPIYWDGAAWKQYGTGASENIGNSDLVLTGDRVLSGDPVNTFKLEMNDLGSFILHVADTGAGTIQVTNAGSTLIQSDAGIQIESVLNHITLTAATGQISLQSTELIANSLDSGDPNNKKFVMSDDGGLLTAVAIGSIINIPYTTAILSDNLLLNATFNGLFPNDLIGSQRIFTNISDSAGSVAIAIKYASSSWAVKLDFIKAS